MFVHCHSFGQWAQSVFIRFSHLANIRWNLATIRRIWPFIESLIWNHKLHPLKEKLMFVLIDNLDVCNYLSFGGVHACEDTCMHTNA